MLSQRKTSPPHCPGAGRRTGVRPSRPCAATVIKACLLIAVDLTQSVPAANALTVLPNRAQVASASFEEFRTTVLQTVGGDFTSTWFETDAFSTLEVVSWNLDDESDWYVVQPGELFSAAGIAAGEYPVLFTLDDPRPPVPLYFAPDGFLYLGFNTGVSYDDDWPVELADFRDVFGWLKLGLDHNFVWYAADSAAAYDATGIIVGTTVGVPEPSTAILSGLAVAALAVACRHYSVGDQRCP